MDPRLMNSDDSWVVQSMAKAALLCLKNDDSGHRYSISEVSPFVFILGYSYYWYKWIY